MALRIFKPSRIVAVLLVAGAGAWIYSGQLARKSEPAAGSATVAPAVAVIPPQKVSVTLVRPAKHQRQITLSCVTQSDQRSLASARGAGIIVDLKVRRGSAVRAGQVVALLSDEGRDAAVKQAEALFQQRQAEYDANKRLIDTGNVPRNNLPALQAGVAAAQAALAAAQAEAEKSAIKSPIDGLVDSVPVEVGQAVQVGATIAEIVGPDPMLAVGEVNERQRGHLTIGQNVATRFIDGDVRNGTISFVSLSADKATRTYRVEARMPNPDAAIADGVTCEMSVTLAPVDAVSIPRSSLIFSDAGELGVRVVDDKDVAHFMPVSIVDDETDSFWVTGIDKPVRVIVVGQDFVKDGEAVAPTETTPAAASDVKAAPPA